MTFDPFGIGTTFLSLQYAWLKHPKKVLEAQQECAFSMGMLNFNAFAHMAGASPSPCTKAASADERFADNVWHENPVECLTMQSYLTYTRWLERVIYDTPGAPKKARRSGAFWARQWINAAAPSNFFWTNPVAVKKAWESNGASVNKGIRNFLADAIAGDVQTTHTEPFQPGSNLAITPGAIVFRNDIMEVIHYRPVRDQVHAIPIVLVPPWINKYYILDLDEKMSMVRHLVAEGFEVFTISWKNPDASLANSTYERYVLDGVLVTIEVARAMTKAPQVHAVGYCIGGTALATLMAWLNKKSSHKQHNMPVAHWTLLSSLIDFSRPGEIEAFINEQSLTTIESIMTSKGYLDKDHISWAFRMLRPNSLIWHYVVHKYLYGESPPPFSVLFWNADSTRLPRTLHSFCLRELYLKNKLMQQNAVALDAIAIDMALVKQPLYAVGATEDHITPWRGTFKTLSLVKSPARYALSNSGHILGIINPPNGNSRHHFWVGDATGENDAKAWHARQKLQHGSWWQDWTAWLHDKCGPMQTPLSDDDPAYPKLADAPGTYIFEQ